MAAGWTHGMTALFKAPAVRPVRLFLAWTVRRVRRLGGGAVRVARRGRGFAAGLAAAAVVLALVSGYFGYQLYQQHQEESRNQDVVAAARQSALNFTSLDYRHYDRDSKNVLSSATGEFKKQFSARTKQLTKLVAANKSVSEGQVLEAGIARANDRAARVLVVVDSKVSNAAAPQGQARNYRLQLDLVHEGGRWLTSDVEFVG
jgi:Mce-associated membrane protein